MRRDPDDEHCREPSIALVILEVVVVELLGGFLREVVIPKIKRLFGEEEKKEDKDPES